MYFSAEILKTTRRRNAMTTRDLALIMGIHYQQIVRWENGCNPSSKSIKKLAAAFGVDVGYFFK